MIITIKPKELFNMLPAKGADRLVTTRLPDRRDPAIDDRSISALETVCLLTLQKIVNARTCFEFGTALGATALNLALNAPDGIVYTIDLPPTAAAQSIELAPWGDSPQNQYALAVGAREWDGIVTNVVQLTGDSRTFDYSPYIGACNLVWIDGGHERDVVESDTHNALEMVKAGSRAVIAWHDCYEPIAPGVEQCLLGMNFDVYHVAGTVLAFAIFV